MLTPRTRARGVDFNQQITAWIFARLLPIHAQQYCQSRPHSWLLYSTVSVIFQRIALQVPEQMAMNDVQSFSPELATLLGAGETSGEANSAPKSLAFPPRV
jgi:hypothetical protein